ncbi:hypothetical protein [Natrinema pallidum]|uniref:hypothetical protein n=1 Tax=Natrinema pallidum TaxID=69527 RepID=UPI0037526EC3
MLTTKTYTLDDAIAELTEQIDDLEVEIEDLEDGTDDHAVATGRKDRLQYFRNGLEWQRDEEGWDGDAEIELGALTAGEEAKMHREASDTAERKEMRLWFVAASTVDAPYAADTLSETFSELANVHPAYAAWAESEANGLGVPESSGNRSSMSSTATGASKTSRDELNSTTTSSSDSPTA